MMLSIKERVIFAGVFKFNQDTQTEACVQRSIIKAISIPAAEAKEMNLSAGPDNRLTWDAVKGLDKEFSFTVEQITYLKESVYNLSKGRGITQQILPLCEKIQRL